MNYLTELADKNFSDKGSHKHNYTHVYHRYLSKFESEKINLLEIGFAEGGSCAMWLEYFKNGKIYGADYYSKKDLESYYLEKPYISGIIGSNKNLKQRMESVFQNERFTFLQIDQSSIEDLRSIKNKFDVIIDDGSHIHGDIQQTLGSLALQLNIGGYYFIEDLNCKRSFNNKGRSKSSLNQFSFSLISKIYARDTRFLLNQLKEKNRFKSRFITNEQSDFISKNFVLETMESISSGTIACLKRIS